MGYVFGSEARSLLGSTLQEPPQFTVDSTQVPPEDRLRFWKAHVNKPSGLDIICGTSNFVGRMTSRSLGLCTVHGVQIDTPHRAVRARSSADTLFANVQVRNEGARFCGRREVPLPQGSMILYEASEPYELDFDGGSDAIVLAVSRSELQKRVADLQFHIDEAVEYEPGKVQLLAHLMRGILATQREAPQAVKDGLSEAVLNLLVATLYDCPDASNRLPTFGSAATLQRIRSFINANIADPNLNPVMTADALGITVSYLHKLFLQSNTTLMQYVLAERLERCRRDIAKGDRSSGLSQIAYGWGFNDASHFSRSFRKRFGMSPRQYQAEVLARNGRFADANR